MLQRLAIATIRTSHGVSGFLKVKSLSGEVEHFFRLKKVYIGPQEQPVPFEVEKAVPMSGADVLLKVKGIDTPEEARKLRGREIWVDRQDAAPLKEGEFYLGDLSGCRVLKRGQEVGRVKTVIEGGASSFLEVVDPQGRSRLVPFSEPFVGEVRVDAGTIELKEDALLP